MNGYKDAMQVSDTPVAVNQETIHQVLDKIVDQERDIFCCLNKLNECLFGSDDYMTSKNTDSVRPEPASMAEQMAMLFDNICQSASLIQSILNRIA